MKNNEDYEQRLKEHLYLFEEKQPKEEEQMAREFANLYCWDEG